MHRVLFSGLRRRFPFHSVSSFFLSSATLVGTILGVGMFSLPAVAVEAGRVGIIMVALVVLCVVLYTHLAYGHTVVLTASKARLPGYASVWLGPSGRRVAWFSQGLGLLGSSLAYILLGGTFLAHFISIWFPIPPLAGMALFTIAGAFIVWRGTRRIAEAEFVMVLVMLICLGLLTSFAIPQWDGTNFDSLALFGHPWRAYGVLMFALWGMAVIPEASETCSRRLLGPVVFASIFFSFVVTALFVVVIVGADGTSVSKDALTGLVSHYGTFARSVGYGFGVFATFTSYLTLTRTTMDMFQYDLRQFPIVSFAAAVGIPLIALLAGINDFVTVMAVTGAVSLGLEGSLAIIIEQHAVRLSRVKPIVYLPRFAGDLVIVFLSLGILSEIFATFGLLH